MEANFRSYNFASALGRVDTILTAPAGAFQGADSLPDRDNLSYTNGYYANCAAIFIDIRDSSGLTAHYKRPRLAKIYRTFISEMVANFTSHRRVREISIVGDCVWAVVDSPYKSDLDELFDVAARSHSLLNVIDHELVKNGFDRTIAAGIGLDYGRALMIKAGYAGSGINDVVYMGDVVNRAAHLAAEAHSAKWGSSAIRLSAAVHINLDEHRQPLCTGPQRLPLPHGSVYSSNAVNVEMQNWLDSQQ